MKRLRIGISTNVFNAFDARFQHVFHGITAATAYTNDLDHCTFRRIVH